MEAWRFGFNLPPANKFDPTDADIVAHYLLPRAVGYPNPYAHAIIDADPCSCPPWELLRRHGHGESDHAFFFAPPRVPDPKKRAYRAVAPGEDDGVGGTWDGQRSDAIRLVLLRGGDGDGARPLEITFRRANLSYYHGQQKKKTSGWVMHEYQIVDPPHLSATVLSRVRITRDGKKMKKQQQQQQGKEKDKQQQAAAVDGDGGAGRQVVPPGPDQPGPSNYYGQPGPSNYYDQPVGGGGVMGDTSVCYGGGGGGGNNLYEGYGSGGGDCFAAGDDGGSYDANGGGVMGETGAYYGDGGNGYLNHGSGYYLDHGDGSGGGGCYCFDVRDGNSYDYEYHNNGGNGG
ncbi:unnamed protein product [Urochloa decumbens]|uniref:NAC domain-containing protein n=1 Tax=Urochloa decumbens TaxID=240449 RepID=A0ABC9B6P6_9POAL